MQSLLKYFTCCFSNRSVGHADDPHAITTSPTEKRTRSFRLGNDAIIQSNSSKGRPTSSRRKYSGNSFKIEISLTRILSLKQKETKQFPEPSASVDLDDTEYKKEVAKRWRIRRDNAIKNNLLFYDGGYDPNGTTDFQRATNNIPYLLSVGFKEYPHGPVGAGTVLKRGQHVFLSRDAFKPFFQDVYGVMPYRSPCEAYLTISDNAEQQTVVRLLEKKHTGHGTLEPKLWTSISWKKEYEIALGGAFHVEYAICLDGELEVQFKNLNIRKFTVVNTLLNENNIPLFFGEHPEYLKQVNAWTKIQ